MCQNIKGQALAYSNAQALRHAWMGRITSTYKDASAWTVESLALWRTLAFREEKSLALALGSKDLRIHILSVREEMQVQGLSCTKLTHA